MFDLNNSADFLLDKMLKESHKKSPKERISVYDAIKYLNKIFK